MSASTTPTAARSFYLHAEGESFLCLYHEAGAAPAGSAVLLCPPFGWDDICSYRSRRDWAEHLARAGHPTLRFDMPGSGDSAGGPRDPGRPQAWTHAILQAGEWLREHSGAPRVAVVGIGMSGLLAARAALEGGRIDELVLWAAPARGKALTRELKAFSRLEVAGVLADGEQAPPDLVQEGEILANGYLLSAETVEQLGRLDIGELGRGGLHTTRALLLGREGAKADERLAATLRESGVAVELAPGPGYELMMLEPQDARAPTAVFATVSAWLARGGEEDPPSPAREGRSPRPPLAARRASAEQMDRLELAPGGTGVRERVLSMQHPEGTLFGVLAEPPGERRELTALLLNAGPQRHTGPNRMWVEIARRWAAQGVSTMRIDLSGIGDSDGDAGALVRVATLYSPEYVVQVRAVLDMLAERGLPRRFLLLGLCAGAYWSLHAALQDERVAGLVMLNPRALVWNEWAYTVRRTRDIRERMLRPETWRRVLRGDVTPARHLETARSLAERALSAPTRMGAARRAQALGLDPGEALFDQLRERDQRAVLLLTGKEPLREDFERNGLLTRAQNWPNLELVISGTSADTHTLTPMWLQKQVHELADRALAAELARLPAPGAAAQGSGGAPETPSTSAI